MSGAVALPIPAAAPRRFRRRRALVAGAALLLPGGTAGAEGAPQSPVVATPVPRVRPEGAAADPGLAPPVPDPLAPVTPAAIAVRSPGLAEARAARLDGDYRNAYLAYRLAGRAAADEAGRAAAALESAETLLADDLPDGAVEVLDEWIDAYPTHPRQHVARALRARALQESVRAGTDSLAVAAWREVLHVGAVPCADAVRVRLASHLFALGRADEAWRELDAALAETASPDAPAAARLLVLEAVEARGKPSAPDQRPARRPEGIEVAILDAAVRVGRLPESVAAAAWRAVGAALASGDGARADALRWRIVSEWPETAVAWKAVEELGASRVPASLRARIAAANGKWEAVRDATGWLLANAPSDPEAGVARALRGIAANALGEGDADALLDLGGTVDSGRRWGARCLWEVAERRRAAMDLGGAVERYARLAATFPGTVQAGQALYRLGRLLPGTGDVARADRAMNQAADAGPVAFHLVRARQVLRRPVPRAPRDVDAFVASGAITAVDWAEWDAWLAAHGLPGVADAALRGGAPGSGGLPPQPPAVAGPHAAATDLAVAVGRLDALLAFGFLAEAEDAAREVCNLRGFAPGVVAAVAWRLRAGGHVPFSMTLGLRLLRILDEAGHPSTLGLPAVARKLAFPLAYARLVAASAAREGIDPYVLLGLMRQESWFDPRADSTAKARGLTQFIRQTAEDVAKKLAWPNWAWDDMYRPYVSVPFGARYLATLLKEFRSDPLQATAAYNAGPGPVTKWAADDRDRDPDLFVEGITYRETRGYVTSVATNAEAYRDTYGVA